MQPLKFEHDFLRILTHRCIVRFMPGFYSNVRTRVRIAKMFCQSPHDQAQTAFHTALISAIHPMGLINKILHWGSATLSNKDGLRKAADGGWGPHGTKRPSLVLEVAWSETSAKLRRDCQYWVDPLRGEASMAIGIKIHTNAPHITIDQWEWSSELS